MPPESCKSSTDKFCLEVLPAKPKGKAFCDLWHGAWFTYEGRVYLKRSDNTVFWFNSKVKNTEVLDWNNSQIHVIPCELTCLRIRSLI